MRGVRPVPRNEKGPAARGRSRSWTGGVSIAALAISLVWHAILLLFVGGLYGRMGERSPPPAAGPSREISYVPFPRIATTGEEAHTPDSARSPPLPDAPEAAPPMRASSPDTASAAAQESGTPDAIAGSPTAATAASLLGTGFTDSRLLADMGRLRAGAPPSLKDRFDASLGVAMGVAEDSLAEERGRERSSNQVRVLGRSVTIFGDSMNTHWRGFVVGNRRMTLPVDGREWEDLQMKKQRDDFVRDSILRDRAAATRARMDAARKLNQD